MSHMVYGDEPDNPINDLQAQRLTDMLAQAARAGCAVRDGAPVQLAGGDDAPRPGLRHGPPGIAVYGLSPIPARGDMGLMPAMTLKCPVALVQSMQAGEGVSYGHTWIADRDTTVALLPIGYADGVFRTLGGRFDVLINGRRRPQRRPDLHGPVRGRPRPRTATSPKATTRSCSGRARTANPPRRTGRTCWAPSTTRSSPARAAASSGPTASQRQAKVVERWRNPVARDRPPMPAGWRVRPAWPRSAALAGVIRGPVAAPSRQPPTTPTRTRISSFSTPTAACVVTTPDGVPLAVREVGPTDAPLTVVFAHGFCLRMGAFHFQRARLTEQWGAQVRMVFYDQRGHGQSGDAPPETYTVTSSARTWRPCWR